jgi:ATP-dependent DNA helicase RecQ
MIEQAKSILKNTFGYDEFRLQQEAAITQVLNKKDALVIMPTGGGKSLCYQIPAMIFEGMTIVISPLISLMKDQVEQLREYDIPSVYLNSSLRPEAYDYNVKKILNGEVKLLYVAPETLMMDRTKEILKNIKVDCFTIDEAHCISEWGHDFRPEYRQLATVRKSFPDAVCVALTATATPRVQRDIKRTLEFDESESFVSSFDRPNLFLKIVDKKDPENQILDFLYTRKKQSGIIYCFSRRQVDELTELLVEEGYDAKPYHAGLMARERAINQRAFIRDDARIIVATIAFGMGINKPNVRYVVHYDMPQNIESYYQQIGRAGRDGLRADCVLLFSYADTQKIKYFINQKKGTEKTVAERHLEKLLKFLEFTGCRRKPLLDYFGETYTKDPCEMCDNDLSVEEDVEDLTLQAQKFLNCVLELEEEYGAGQVIDVLRGSKNQKVLENEHDKVEHYGSGLEWSKKQWEQMYRLLMRQRFLKRGSFGVLEVEDKAMAVLSGKENVYGILDRTDVQTAEDDVVRTSSEIENQYNVELFELLREKRKELADADDVPPYAIFPDTTLIEMAYYYPQSKDSLDAIYGVGSVKKAKFGDSFIGIIKTYSKNHDIVERQKTLIKKVREVKTGEKFEQVGNGFNEGKSIKLLAEEHGVKEVTILGHLKKFLDEGNDLRLEGLLQASNLSDRQRDQVLKAFKKRGHEMLRFVYDECKKQIGYDELRIMQLYYMASMK